MQRILLTLLIAPMMLFSSCVSFYSALTPKKMEIYVDKQLYREWENKHKIFKARKPIAQKLVVYGVRRNTTFGRNYHIAYNDGNVVTGAAVKKALPGFVINSNTLNAEQFSQQARAASKRGEYSAATNLSAGAVAATQVNQTSARINAATSLLDASSGVASAVLASSYPEQIKMLKLGIKSFTYKITKESGHVIGPSAPANSVLYAFIDFSEYKGPKWLTFDNQRTLTLWLDRGTGKVERASNFQRYAYAYVYTFGRRIKKMPDHFKRLQLTPDQDRVHFGLIGFINGYMVSATLADLYQKAGHQ